MLVLIFPRIDSFRWFKSALILINRSPYVWPPGHLWYLFKVTMCRFWRSSVKTTLTLPFWSSCFGNCDTPHNTLSVCKLLTNKIWPLGCTEVSNCVYLLMQIIYLRWYIIYLRWSTRCTVLKSHRSNMSIIYIHITHENSVPFCLST